MKAGIKIWVLTGDKQETAIEIGKNCKLIQSDMDVIVINEETPMKIGESLDTLKKKVKASKKEMALVVDGKTLGYIINDKTLSQKFFFIGIRAKAVICCRVSPLQKAEVVGIVKNNKKNTT